MPQTPVSYVFFSWRRFFRLEARLPVRPAVLSTAWLAHLSPDAFADEGSCVSHFVYRRCAPAGRRPSRVPIDDALSEIAGERNGDGEALLEILRERTDDRTKGFYQSKANELETYLDEHGDLDDRDLLRPTEMWRYVRADLAAAIQTGAIWEADLNRVFQRLDDGPPARPAAPRPATHSHPGEDASTSDRMPSAHTPPLHTSTHGTPTHGPPTQSTCAGRRPAAAPRARLPTSHSSFFTDPCRAFMTDSASNTPSSRPDSADAPDWTGTWRVLRYGGEAPDVPTYYRASRQSWDVIKDPDGDRHVARHPILQIDGSTLILKDEGAPDDDRERWSVDVSGDRVTVTAETGPHHGAIGIAERVESISS